MNRRANAVLATVGTCLTLSAAGCGVPTETTPRLVAASSAPSALLPPGPSGTDTAAPTVPNARLPRLYFVDARGRLVSVIRATRSGPPRVILDSLMSELGGGLTEAERGRGLGSAMPPGLSLSVVDLHDGQATINLSGDVSGPSGDQAVLAVAQVVLSATTVPTVTSVRLTRAGAPLEAPLVGGALTSDPLVRTDYRPLLH
ncbi:MAG TPA: GerMN domain-containing protein [Mycobacteriales bacterium]|nr:GerMN domain-containing protein [Mycobacteriales bacterium]